MSDDTNPTKPGNSTSEFAMARLVIILGAILSGATVTLGTLVERFPDAGWLGVVAGIVAAAASAFGYSQSRAKVKAADILSGVPGASVSPLTPPHP